MESEALGNRQVGQVDLFPNHFPELKIDKLFNFSTSLFAPHKLIHIIYYS